MRSSHWSAAQVDNTGTVANPGPMIVDHQGKFLYLANKGPNLTANQRGKFGKRILHRSDHG